MARRDDRQRKATVRRDRRALAAAAGGVMVLLACAAAIRALPGTGPGPGPSAAIGGPFTLVDSQGRAHSEGSFRGRYMLIFFGYTGCADVCPRTLTEMSEALDRVDPDARRIQPVFITVDPKHDTPDRLGRYVASFSPTLIGLTGTPEQLGAVERMFGIVVDRDSRDGRQDLDHGAVIFLLGPDGRFIAPLSATASRVALRAALDRYVPAPATDRG